MPTYVPTQHPPFTPKDSDSGLFSKSRDESAEIRFREEDPVWTLSEVVLNLKVRETIDDVIVFCQNRKKLVDEWGLNSFLKGNTSIGINLYGASGTGKSCTANAIAHALGKKIVKVDYSEIQDSKLGQTEKNLTALFKTASENGSVIFMDEADGLLGRRASAGSNAAVTNDIKSHLLTLIDRYDVIIIYATNLFKNFDRAFFRRILYHIKYPMPTQGELKEIWKFHMGHPNIKKDPENFSFDEIAELCEGSLSGGDIKNLTLKLCVKLAAGRINALTTEIVKQEIASYKENLADSRGERIVPESEMTDEEREMLKDNNDRL